MPEHLVKFCLYLALIILCQCKSKQGISTHPSEECAPSIQYSTIVKDAFYVQTQLPLEYKDSIDKRYPVVIMLDANFHFPMLAASVRQYERGGLLPPVILVGVGYKTFKDMDSLRVRDYLYPAPLPSDELKAPGGGERFRQFVVQELLPSIDSTYRTTTNNRALLGHSFGGYFTLYTLLSQARNKSHEFKNFVSASAPVWYNNFYLNQLPPQLLTSTGKDSINLFLSVGDLENPRWDVKPNKELANKLKAVKTVNVKGGSYSQLGHMDTGQLSFLKGLQEFYHK